MRRVCPTGSGGEPCGARSRGERGPGIRRASLSASSPNQGRGKEPGVEGWARGPLRRLNAAAGVLGPGWHGAPGPARNHTGTRLGARSCPAFPRGAALASKHLLTAEDGLPGRVVRRGASARGDRPGPGGALTSCRRCSFLSCAISRVRLVSTSRRRCCSSLICFIRATCVGGYSREAGGSASGPVPYSPQNLKLTCPPSQAPKRNGLTASLAVQASPRGRVQHGPHSSGHGPWWPHPEPPPGPSLCDGAELLWGELPGRPGSW